MDGKEPTQATGADRHAGGGDGIEDAATIKGAESAGGAYPHPDAKDRDDGEGFRHGGQSHIAYSGPGDAEDGDDNPNATTR